MKQIYFLLVLLVLVSFTLAVNRRHHKKLHVKKHHQNLRFNRHKHFDEEINDQVDDDEDEIVGKRH
jgi:uncharacterized protein YggL (DUF469 family)